MFGSAGVLAGQYVATDNPFPIQLNGTNVSMTGYNINNETYFRLRDIADTVGGFTVDFQNDTILLAKDGYVYPEDEPSAAPTQEIIDTIGALLEITPAFKEGENSSAEYAKDFVFYFYTGKQSDLQNGDAYGWDADTVNGQYELLFGIDIPEIDEYYKDGVYWIPVSNRGETQYIFDTYSETENGIELTYKRVIMYNTQYSVETDFYGNTVCTIAPSDNENGFIIKSIVSYDVNGSALE